MFLSVSVTEGVITGMVERRKAAGDLVSQFVFGCPNDPSQVGRASAFLNMLHHRQCFDTVAQAWVAECLWHTISSCARQV